MTEDHKSILPEPTAHETLAQRKERLMLQCSAYRVAVAHSKSTVRSRMSIQSMAKTAAGLVGLRAAAGSSAFSNLSGLLDMKNLSSANIRKMLPLIVSGYSLLARRSLIKPLLRGAAIVGGAGAAAYLYSRQKSRKKHRHIALHEHL